MLVTLKLPDGRSANLFYIKKKCKDGRKQNKKQLKVVKVKSVEMSEGNLKLRMNNNRVTYTNKKNARDEKNVDRKKVILNLIKPQDMVLPVPSGFDCRSKMGQFGWISFEVKHIPFIYRYESTKLVALRIVNQVIFPRFLNSFRQLLFDFFVVKSFTMTDVERQLYNDINFNHCNGAYGLNSFQSGVQLVSLDDLTKLYDFFVFAYGKLKLKSKELSSNYGYIAINGNNNIVPFVRIRDSICFPIVYFDGDFKYLIKFTFQVDDYYTGVLKFLIRLMNVELKFDKIQVITLDEIKKFFEPNTTFEHTWIGKESDVFLNTGKGSNECIMRVQNADEPVTPLTSVNKTANIYNM
ncbi:PREDICTED: uncharacterized protein LOC108563830 isoform X2 [Nicrophorus vespilloides]|uniref:Uncharacterized protein LOC108563830 isoform X2 n=1 Tax=Nicrophorus vespilloides TaxID=110193 RepID=A0ABM1MU63_NICVS|nr:PREDICTED: uncharacterized protein LOC108563830 isoform X2 [Nicrophorus vespilloides]